MLVSHVVPHQMQWQSRLFNDFDYIDGEVTDYHRDSDKLNRLIVTTEAHDELKNNVFIILKNDVFDDVLVQALSTKNPIITLSGDLEDSWSKFMKSSIQDIGIGLDVFTDYKRGQNELEQKMFARFSFIAKHKREIIDSGKRIWLLGFTQPHEVKRYGREIYACINDVVVREAFWRTKLSDKLYSTIHEGWPDDPVVPLGVYESIRKFNSWVDSPVRDSL